MMKKNDIWKEDLSQGLREIGGVLRRTGLILLQNLVDHHCGKAVGDGVEECSEDEAPSVWRFLRAVQTSGVIVEVWAAACFDDVGVIAVWRRIPDGNEWDSKFMDTQEGAWLVDDTDAEYTIPAYPPAHCLDF